MTSAKGKPDSCEKVFYCVVLELCHDEEEQALRFSISDFYLFNTHTFYN